MHECANILRGQPKWLDISCERLKDGPSVAEHDDRVPAGQQQQACQGPQRAIAPAPNQRPVAQSKADVLQFFSGVHLQPARGRIGAVTNFDNVYAA